MQNWDEKKARTHTHYADSARIRRKFGVCVCVCGVFFFLLVCNNYHQFVCEPKKRNVSEIEYEPGAKRKKKKKEKQMEWPYKRMFAIDDTGAMRISKQIDSNNVPLNSHRTISWP